MNQLPLVLEDLIRLFSSDYCECCEMKQSECCICDAFLCKCTEDEILECSKCKKIACKVCEGGNFIQICKCHPDKILCSRCHTNPKKRKPMPFQRPLSARDKYRLRNFKIDKGIGY